jgi:hypothetical protein
LLRGSQKRRFSSRLALSVLPVRGAPLSSHHSSYVPIGGRRSGSDLLIFSRCRNEITKSHANPSAGHRSRPSRRELRERHAKNWRKPHPGFAQVRLANLRFIARAAVAIFAGTLRPEASIQLRPPFVPGGNGDRDARMRCLQRKYPNRYQVLHYGKKHCISGSLRSH